MTSAASEHDPKGHRTRLEALKQAHPEWLWELPDFYTPTQLSQHNQLAALVSALQESESENASLRRLLDARTEALDELKKAAVGYGFAQLDHKVLAADKALALTINDFAGNAPAQHEEK